MTDVIGKLCVMRMCTECEARMCEKHLHLTPNK